QGDAHAGARHAPAGRERIMTAEQFVAELDAQNQRLLSRLAPDDTLKPEVEGDLNVPNLLKVALRNELEATEIAARWLVTTDAVDVKLALARQVGDEAKHYRMIAERLRALGVDARSFNPLAKGGGPLFQYLDKLTSTVERVAAGQFTREAIAVVKNRQFIGFFEAAGDAETAALYRDVIEPDERYHHELGRTLLLRLATTPEAQAAATGASRVRPAAGLPLRGGRLPRQRRGILRPAQHLSERRPHAAAGDPDHALGGYDGGGAAGGAGDRGRRPAGALRGHGPGGRRRRRGGPLRRRAGDQPEGGRSDRRTCGRADGEADGGPLRQGDPERDRGAHAQQPQGRLCAASGLGEGARRDRPAPRDPDRGRGAPARAIGGAREAPPDDGVAELRTGAGGRR